MVTMRQSLLAISLLLLGGFLHGAHATDVTISSSTIPSAQFPVAGVAMSITVSATSGSPTVTSSAAFPSRLVGVAGYKLAINGTDYIVSSTNSTSSITLTTNFGSSTNSYTATLYPLLLIRFYSDRAFTPFGASYVVQPGSPAQSNGFFAQYGCSIISGQLYLPTITLPSQLDSADALGRTARYSAQFFTTSGARLIPYQDFTSFQIPASPTSTTWAVLKTYNAPASTYQLDSTTYSRDQINSLLPILLVSSLPATCTAASTLPVEYLGAIYTCTATNTWSAPANASGALTASRALASNASGLVASTSVTSTELGYLSGVTSAIQTQLGAKASTALDNLSGTAIAVDLNPATPGSPSLGSPGNPWHYLYVSGQSGTPGTNYFKITGASTGGARTKTLGDASDTLIGTITGSGAPGSTPAYIGQMYIDTTGLKVYVATGTSSSADFKILN